jgi:hydroxymethylpyrimidine pyrophosphatase-like HAD family hydrolase
MAGPGVRRGRHAASEGRFAVDAQFSPSGPDSHLASFFTDTEAAFYGGYDWCLNPFLRVDEALGCLRTEIAQLQGVPADWRLKEVMTNIFLLACAVSDSADDCLGCKRVDFAKFKRKSRLLRPGLALLEIALALKERRARARLAGLRAWRARWEESLHAMLRASARRGPPDMGAYVQAASALRGLLDEPFPAQFLGRHIKSPRAFRSQDFSIEDILLLAERFCSECPEKRQPCLVVGLRTAGSYFAPVLRAYLANQGYVDVAIVTLRPKGGAGPDEWEPLRRLAGRGARAVVIDEPVYQGATLAVCMEMLFKAGFTPSSTVVLFPVHVAARDWRYTNARVALNGCRVITMQPEEAHRYDFLHAGGAEQVLRGYFAGRGWTSVTFIGDARASALNEHLHRTSDEAFHTRLKRVYAVQLARPGDPGETRYVIAKSVGYGWMGYQAFFAAKSLARFVPPVLGLHNGTLFSEWVGDGSVLQAEHCDRRRMVDTLAGYIAARAEGLRFEEDPSPALCRQSLQLGTDMLVDMLANTYRPRLVASLRKCAIRGQLSQLSGPKPALVDGKIRACEWVDTPVGFLKTDFEQHGMGRMDHSVTDPAYDLADSMLSFLLSPDEERALLERYASLTGDTGVSARMPLYKLLAAEAAMGTSLFLMQDPRLAVRHPEFSKTYIDAWTFAMIQMARFCAGFVDRSPPASHGTAGPVVFSDVDGVIDRHLFRFPTTTQDGLRALSLLKAHGLPVYLNTARSCHDVREYCAAYGLAGGVAESGSCLWDAIAGRERVLVDPAALGEIDRVREALGKVPGVFTNPYYRYSIKAFTYDETGTRPLSMPMVTEVLARVGARTLAVHQTTTDTAISFRDVDKGTGLAAMLGFIGREGAHSIAIGDTEPDLAMFRVATRSHAPSHIWVRSLATLLGCRIAGAAYQAGFLEIASAIVTGEGAQRGGPAGPVQPQFAADGQARLLIGVLGDADRGARSNLLSALLDARTIRALLG